jgi:aryl-alcohol dehydrogenase-like predicted oxidoreductase
MEHSMTPRALGDTGIMASPLGLGAGHIGAPEHSEAEVARLLHAALDAGVTFIDTARGYGLSEERIGRHLAGRRGEVVLSTKVGYGVPGHEDWTPGCVRAGVEAALGRLRTDHVDVVHLHSCPADVLAHGGVVEVLADAKRAGKIGAVAYSGENEALAHALTDGLIEVVQCSINAFDQGAARGVLRGTRRGVIAKRPLGNAPWRFAGEPHGHYAHAYWRRMRAMGFDPGELGWREVALRWAVHHSGAHTAIVGTSRAEHLLENAEVAARGPLPAEVAAALEAAYDAADEGWRGEL